MVELRKVGYENVREIVALSVAEHQRGLVGSNTDSILEAYLAITNDGIALPFGIYDQDTPVGFIMLTYGARKDANMPSVAYGNYCIWKFMIDARYQRRGYGEQAVQAALNYMRQSPCGPAVSCWLCCHPENAAAMALYHRCGFEENGEVLFGETVLARRL